ncbi:Cof-type HAD-IIB family hydrolase [Thermogemmatispora sp.]|uniref:Cof-type HAD-IIB family hydrolase n=1 Tax=Thermogemmatispora sp. TaxID=1968838 RepID=UPI001DEEEB25|nr:Cof-type HAD-IIB family hydrolase [Thermogemmatispora sp.]MBX5449539.1 HAD family phosphatase [Thermogemmatispora sp.]
MTMPPAQAACKLLVIDIDGTLLTPGGEITEGTRAAIAEAQAAGVTVTLATARRYGNTASIARELALRAPLILYDGALIVEHPGGRILYSNPLPTQVVQQSIALFLAEGLQPVIQPLTNPLHEEVWIGPAELDSSWQQIYFTVHAAELRRLPRERLLTLDKPVLRLVALEAPERLRLLVPAVAALDCSWLLLERGNYQCGELSLLRAGCSKATAVAALAELLHIPLTEVMAIGDNENDIAMLSLVGFGIAMGQASAAVKQAARAITTSNSEDGVAYAIEHYLLRAARTSDSNSRRRSTCL